MRCRRKILNLIFCIALTFIVSFSFTHSAYAQYGQELAANLALGNYSPIDVAVNIINWTLGILALIAVIIMLYAGFLWMTSQGAEDKLEKAKQIMRNGLIGLIIILCAWGISLFVVNLLGEWTGGESTTPTSCTGSTCSGYLTSDSEFTLTASDPYDSETDVSLCHNVSLTFSLAVLPASVTTSNVYMYVSGGGVNGADCTENNDCKSAVCSAAKCVGDNVSGSVSYATKYITFYPDVDYEKDTVYVVTITGDLQGVDGEGLTYYFNSGADDAFSFTTGEDTDTIPPYVVLTDADYPSVPADGDDDTCRNTIIRTTFNEGIDPLTLPNAKKTVRLSAYTPATTTISTTYLDLLDVEMGTRNDTNDTFYSYPAATLAATTDYAISLYSGDASTTNKSGAITDMCSNPLDGNYNGSSEGSPTDDFIDAATSASTAINPDWAYPWNFKTGTVENCDPTISSFTPTSGYYSEDTISILGQYLDQASDFTFYDAVSAVVGTNCFNSSYALASSCLVSSTETNLQVRVPVGAQTGLLTAIGRTASNTSASNFTVSSPYISSLSPSAGPESQAVTIYGTNFGSTAGHVYFEGIEAEQPCASGWHDTYIIVKVPTGLPTTLPSGIADVQVVTSGGKHSNYKNFTVNTETPGPLICSISPSCHATGEATATLTGESFGEQTGSAAVDFYSLDALTEASAPISSWTGGSGSNTAVIEHIPDDYLGVNGAYNTVLLNSAGAVSNGLTYDVPCSGAPSVVERSTCAPTDSVFPLPNPYLGESEACSNSDVYVAFDTTMDHSTYNSSNIKIYKCNEGYTTDSDVAFSDSACTSLAPGTPVFHTYDPGSGYDGFYITGITYAAGYWYKAVISTGVTSATGVALNEEYSWHFRIKNVDATCIADWLALAPTARTFSAYNTASFGSSTLDTSWENFLATPYNADCIALSSTGTSWSLLDSATASSVTTNQVVSFDATVTPSRVFSASTTSTGGEQGIYMMGTTDHVNTGTVYLKGLVSGGASATAPVTVDLGYCTDDPTCASTCTGSTCDNTTHRCTPVITGFSPADGGVGTCVTINGCYFGYTQNKAYLTNGTTDYEMTYPTGTGCTETWTDDEITAKVSTTTPLAAGYNFKVTSSYGNTVTSSLTTTFEVNSTTRPCLCSISPDRGRPTDPVTLYGEGFGASTSPAAVYFSVALSATNTAWTDTQINSTVPSGAVTGSVYMQNSSGVSSNSKSFTVTCSQNSDCASGCCSNGSCAAASDCNACTTDADCIDTYLGCNGTCDTTSSTCTPYITSISPSSGDTGQAVTVNGCYFGTYTSGVSSVSFDAQAADILCSRSWSNVQIIVETPDSSSGTSSWGTGDEAADVKVTSASATGAALTSNSTDFILDNSCVDDALPALCSIMTTTSPYTGFNYGRYGDAVTVSGQHFSGINEEYCVCTNADDTSEYCTTALSTTPISCNYTSTCDLGSPCTSNRDTYDSATGKCTCTNPSDSTETCAVNYNAETCDYTGTCDLATCTASSANYYRSSGFFEFPVAYQLPDATYTSGLASSSQINTNVPASSTGVTSGTVYAGVNDTATDSTCLSNGLAYNVVCSSCSDCGSGQYCDLSYGRGSYGRCTDSAEGYCAAYPSSCCGSSSCSTVDNPLGTCVSRPSISSTNPVDLSTDNCLNTTISVTFSEAMSLSSGTAGNFLKLYQGSTEVTGTTVSTLDNITYSISLAAALSPSTTYTVQITSDDSSETGFISTETHLAVGSTHAAAVHDIGSGVWSYSFTTKSGTSVCPITSVSIVGLDSEFVSSNYTLTYAGETQSLNAKAYYNSQEIQSIDNVYSWNWSWTPGFVEEGTSASTCSTIGIDTSGSGYSATSATQAVKAGNLDANHGPVTITAVANPVFGWTGSASGTLPVYIYFCASDDATQPKKYFWSYQDSNFNFFLSYCRSDSAGTEILPSLSLPTVVLPVTTSASLMYELLFTMDSPVSFPDNHDGIGVRVYKNDLDGVSTNFADAVTPDLWYSHYFDAERPGGLSLDYDGFYGFTSDRTTYITLPKYHRASNTIFSNILLLSYTQNPETETSTIVQKMIDNIVLLLNVNRECNIEDSAKNRLTRDSQRIQDLGNLQYQLGQYYHAYEKYPDLSAGTYIANMTTSLWPSWESVLGNTLSYSAPLDPLNQFYASESEVAPCPYNSGEHAVDTCWDEVNKDYYSPNISASNPFHTYYYLYQTNSTFTSYDLYAHLEFTEGNWDTTPITAPYNPCSGSEYSAGGCASFNYNYNSASINYESIIE